MDSENKIKWIKLLVGFVGWFLVSTLVLVLIQGDYYTSLFYWLIYMAINVLVMIIFSIWKPMRWVSLGIVSAMAVNFLITSAMGTVYAVVYFVPFTNLAFESYRASQRVPQTMPTFDPNRLPVGFHDGETGTVDREHCVVFGWTFDPDDRAENLRVRVLVDGEEAAQGIADLYRSDLTGSDGCSGGSCGYWFDLWKLVSHNELHTIEVQAQDLQDELWRDLKSTQKSLKCGG